MSTQQRLDAFWSAQRGRTPELPPSRPSSVVGDATVAPPDGDSVVTLPSSAASGELVALAPYDRSNKGRSVPMVWFYRESKSTAALTPTLSPARLILRCCRWCTVCVTGWLAALCAATLVRALRTTLESYPVLCGRYNATPPTAIVLNNAGVPLNISRVEATRAEATAHLPADGTAAAAAAAEPGGATAVFPIGTHAAYVSEKEGMDPDAGLPEAPLLKVKISFFRDGGTAIGLLMQHGVGDADSMMAFTTAWSRAYRYVRGTAVRANTSALKPTTALLCFLIFNREKSSAI